MNKRQRYMMIMNEVSKKDYRDRKQLKKLIGSCGVKTNNSICNMIEDMAEALIIVRHYRDDKVVGYKVVEVQSYTEL